MAASWLLALLFVAAARTAASVRSTRQEVLGLAEEEDFQPLCSKWIVQETCKLLGGALSGADDDITMNELKESLAAGEKSIKVFWYMLGLPTNRSDESSSPEVKCDVLCNTVIERLRHVTTVPPGSDSGCYQDGNETKCDLDLRPKQVRRLVYSTGLPDLHDEDVLREVSRSGWERLVRELESAKEGTGMAPEVRPMPTTIHYAPLQVAMRISNLFRIYPALPISFGQGTVPKDATDPLLQDIPSSLIEAAGAGGDDTGLGTENCKFWCGDAPDCFHSSCSGCGRCAARVKGAFSAVEVAADAPVGCSPVICRSQEDCVEFPYSCSPCSFCQSATGSEAAASSPTTSTRRPAPVLPATPAPGTVAGSAFLAKTAAWQTEVQKRNQEAQVYVTTAIRKFKLQQTTANIEKWFGKAVTKDPALLQEVNRVVNAVAEMLGNVEYIFPGSGCEPNVFAYVYPHGNGARNKQGKYVFHLCQLYMDSETSVQIETLTHEGSHHATAYTDDVCVDEFYGGRGPNYFEMDISEFPSGVAVDQSFTISGNRATVKLIKDKTVVLDSESSRECDHVAYGREECKSLARKDSIKALRNADNLCYYIQDVTDDPSGVARR